MRGPAIEPDDAEKLVLEKLAQHLNHGGEARGKALAKAESNGSWLEVLVGLRPRPAHLGYALPNAIRDIGGGVAHGTALLVAGPIISVFAGAQHGVGAVAGGIAASIGRGVALPVLGTLSACKELCVGAAVTPVAIFQSLGLAGRLCAGEREHKSAPRVALATHRVCGRGDLQPLLALAFRLKDAGAVVKIFTPASPLGHAVTSRHLGIDAVTYVTIATLYDRIREFAPNILLHRFDLLGVAMVAEEQLGLRAVEYNMWPEPGPMDYRFVTVSSQRDVLSKHLVQTLRDVTQEQVFERVSRGPFLLAFSSLVTGHSSFAPGATPREGFQAMGFWDFTEEQQEGFYRSEAVGYFGTAEGGELEAFLDDGEPPVYIGWGSVGHFSGLGADGLAALAVRTLRLVGRRGIVLGSYGNLDHHNLAGLPDAEELQAYAAQHVFWAKWLPHQWLLPRCRAAVHHGGASTTAASLRAGRPTVITPVFVDQPFWGYHVRRLGVGDMTQELRTVAADALAASLRRCEEAEVARRAAELGERLRQEDGAGAAAQWILDYIREDRAHLQSATEASPAQAAARLEPLAVLGRSLDERARASAK